MLNATHLLRTLREVHEKLLDKKTLTVPELAKKHGVSVEKIEAQLKMGIPVEKEHTSNDDIAREIALDHLAEKPDYYTRLKKVEESVSLAEDGEGSTPANAAGRGGVAGIGVGPQGEPGVSLKKKRWEKSDEFAGADVFDVEMEDVMRVSTKLPHERFSKYVGTDEEQGEVLRQHARKNWKRDIVLRDSKTGVMRFLRRRSRRGY